MMIYLILAIVSSTLIAAVLKFSENRNLNRNAVTSANYIAAFSISLIMVISKSEPQAASASINVLILGLIAGILYYLGFIYIQKSIKENGVGITGAVSKIGIIIPVVLSIILWKEIPNILQAIGIVISLSAIILINISSGDIKSLKNFNRTVILLFIISGLVELTTKLFEKYFQTGSKPLYLFITFFTAFLISIYFTFRDYIVGRKFTKTDVMTGLTVGIPNMFTSYFLIESFRYIKASVAFPIYSAGTILLISLSGIIFFKEKLKRKEIFAILMIVAAIVLMNVE
jgi:multidrug transporter EmrE-like cation transporter